MANPTPAETTVAAAFSYATVPVPAGFPPQSGVLRSDGAHVPADPRNADWQAYRAWLEAGNTLAPAAAPAAKG